MTMRGTTMRAIDCPCGHHFEATDDDELFRLCRERIAADAYDAVVA